MRYATQKIAFAYFGVAMALFALQVIFGLTMGYVYVQPNFLAEILPFNIIPVSYTHLTLPTILLV